MRGVFKVAKVAISRAAYGFDIEYSYTVPQELAKLVTEGVRVVVPFGRGNKKSESASQPYRSGGLGNLASGLGKARRGR